MTPRVDPTVDLAFKRLFGVPEHFDLTRHLLNAVLAPDGRRVAELEEGNTVGPTQRSQEKVTIYDVRVKDSGERNFIVEMQRSSQAPWSFVKRELFYLARVHATQHLLGDAHETLQPTVLVCFTTMRLHDDGAYHHRFRMYDAGQRVELGTDLELHTVELSKFRAAADDLKTDLDRWCYFLTRAREMDSESMPATMNGPEFKKAMTVLDRFGMTDAEWHEYLDRDMALRDAASAEYRKTHAREIGFREGEEKGYVEGIHKGIQQGIEKGTQAGLRQGIEKGLRQGIEQGVQQGIRQGIEKGLQEGIEKGLQEGIEKGLQEGRGQGVLIGQIRFTQRILRQPVSPEEELSAMPLDALDGLARSLEQQYLAAHPSTT
ncbi:MAG: Rpn family recombination-promoting nuclease/putative transposase [Gemmataceae bacterium]